LSSAVAIVDAPFLEDECRGLTQRRTSSNTMANRRNSRRHSRSSRSCRGRRFGNTSVVLHRPAGSLLLPDNSQYTNRFEIKSGTSDAIYTVAQSKSGRWWACSCLGWIRHKHCKHLDALGLPGKHRPFEAALGPASR